MPPRNGIHSRWQSWVLWSHYCLSIITLNNCLWEKIPAEVFICCDTTYRKWATTRATGNRRQLRHEGLLSPECHYFHFNPLKCWLGAMPFYESACLKNVGPAFSLCKVVSAGRQWKERNPTKTSRRPSLLPVQKRRLLKTERLLQLQCCVTECCTYPIKGPCLFSSACHVLYSHKPDIIALEFLVRKQFLKT